jgi:hypothetical protein
MQMQRQAGIFQRRFPGVHLKNSKRLADVSDTNHLLTIFKKTGNLEAVRLEKDHRISTDELAAIYFI